MKNNANSRKISGGCLVWDGNGPARLAIGERSFVLRSLVTYGQARAWAFSRGVRFQDVARPISAGRVLSGLVRRGFCAVCRTDASAAEM